MIHHEALYRRTAASEGSIAPDGIGVDDDELGMLDGDPSVYETVVAVYGPRVMAVARRFLRNEVDAADCFQDTFSSVFKNIGGFQRRSSLWTWIRSIAVNECLMKLRVARRRREDDIEDLLPVFDVRCSYPTGASEISNML